MLVPRLATDAVYLGNRARIWLEIDNSEETIVLLGPDDVSANQSDLAIGAQKISYLSPLGKSIFGLRIGQVANFRLNNQDNYIMVREILPGEF